MPSKTPNRNSKEPLENGVRKNQDVEMTDEKSAGKGKAKKGAKEGEDMTVVVPPSKNNKKTNTAQSADADGDVDMDDSEKPEDLEVKVDPVTQTIAGRCSNHSSPPFMCRCESFIGQCQRAL